jgi:mono/diheme cytochrome c family protein
VNAPGSIVLKTTLSVMTLLPAFLACAAGEDAAATNAHPSERTIDFNAEIQPIFEQSCVRCHGSARPKGGFRLDNYESFLKGGHNGPAVFPGDSTNSPLIHYVARIDPDSAMPPEGDGEPLTPAQVELLRQWVDQGAWWGQEPAVERFSMSVAPAVGYNAVSGNDSKFRQLLGQPDGWHGGLESFELHEQVSPTTKYTVTGRALTDDYLARLLIETRDRGFVDFGFEQFRRYDVDTGGYYPGFTPSVFNVNRDLNLDIGRAWVDFGLTLPDWPRLVLGYEYQYRNGEKATLQWGSVVDGANERKTYPAYKDINEHTHMLKLDFDLERAGWRFEDNFRGEWTGLNTRQVNSAFNFGSPNALVQDNIQQSWRAFEGANSLRVERQFRPWLFTSAGYLYSDLSGDGGFSFNQGIPGQTFVPQYTAQSIMVERQSQVANGNVLLGPWQSLALTLGVQGEWTRENGSQDGTEYYDPAAGFPNDPPGLRSALTEVDKITVDENIALRYTRLPFTTLFAEGRLQQESLDHSEDVLGDVPPTFLRETDATSDAYGARAGFDTSPRGWFKLGSSYGWRNRSTTYDGDALFPGTPFALPGYPTFLTARDLTTQEVETRLTVRPVNWLKTTFTWRLVATDFQTTTKADADAGSAGGEINAGNYDSQIFSLNFTMTPWRRLHLFTTLSYQDVQTTTLQETPTSPVVPYQGDTWTVLLHGRYVLTRTTDLSVGYTFSASDFQQDNFNTGLPLGIHYRLNGVQVGLVTRCTKDLTTKLQYGFYQYTEPSSGGANDFTANAVFLSLNWRLN